jgi:excisionase family DNA binding protein
MEDDMDVMTLDEVAAMLKMPRSSVYRLTASREIPHVKIKQRIWFSRSAVKAWWEGKSVPLREVSNIPSSIGEPMRRVR